LSLTHLAVGWGSSLFGASSRGSKLDHIWPMGGPTSLWSSPNWDALSGFEYVSAGLIAFWVLGVVGLTWAFLCSFYLSGSTLAYYLLRRDVDLIDLDEVFVEEELEADGTAVRSGQTAGSSAIPLPSAENQSAPADL
jgi:hypothetical protein